MRRPLIIGATAALALGLAACGDDAQDSSSDSGSSASATSAAASSDAKTDLAEKKFPVSWKDALKKAQPNLDGDVDKIELEPNDAGDYEYKIEMLSDSQKYAVQYDAHSGDKVSEKTDDLDSEDRGTERKQDKIDIDKVISVDEAMKKAKSKHDGPITSWKIEGSKQGPHYEFDIEKSSGSGDYEVQVDAKNGSILTNG